MAVVVVGLIACILTSFNAISSSHADNDFQIQQLKDELYNRLRLDHQKDLEKLTEEVANLKQTCGANDEKTLLQSRSDDMEGWEPVVSQMTNQMTQMAAELQALKNSVAVEGSAIGTSYVRWGSRSCPSSAELVYSGDIGGSHWTYSGAAVDYLCLPKNPVFDNHPIPSVVPGQNHQQLFGAEYEPVSENLHNLVPVCAVCRTTRCSTIMVPATTSCPSGWTLEFGGYMMSGSINHAAATQFICVDHSEQYEPGTNRDDNGKLLYYTVTRCGSLACPPYIDDKIVSCVVCSK